MKATELRIGNWFYSKCKGRNEWVDKHHFSASYIDGKDSYYLENCAEPIPLTEEWLVKFGFDKEEEYDEGGVIDYRMTLMKNSLEFVSFWESEDITGVNQCQTGVDVEYVHQLQNLYFALTGEELELKV